MKKICFLFLLLVGLILSSSKNNDDRFDVLNGQITVLQGQVIGLITLQAEVTSITSTISALHSSLSSLNETVNIVRSKVTYSLANGSIGNHFGKGLTLITTKSPETYNHNLNLSI